MGLNTGIQTKKQEIGKDTTQFKLINKRQKKRKKT